MAFNCFFLFWHSAENHTFFEGEAAAGGGSPWIPWLPISQREMNAHGCALDSGSLKIRICCH